MSVCHVGFLYDVIDNFLSMSAGKSDTCGLTGAVHPDDSLTEMLHGTGLLYWSYIFLHICSYILNSYYGWNEIFWHVFMHVSLMVTHIVGKYCSSQTFILSCIYQDLSMWKYMHDILSKIYNTRCFHCCISQMWSSRQNNSLFISLCDQQILYTYVSEIFSQIIL